MLQAGGLARQGRYLTWPTAQEMTARAIATPKPMPPNGNHSIGLSSQWTRKTVMMPPTIAIAIVRMAIWPSLSSSWCAATSCSVLDTARILTARGLDGVTQGPEPLGDPLAVVALDLDHAVLDGAAGAAEALELLGQGALGRVAAGYAGDGGDGLAAASAGLPADAQHAVTRVALRLARLAAALPARALVLGLAAAAAAADASA